MTSTSGFSRSAARSAASSASVSPRTSRWLTSELRLSCTTLMRLSSVMTWSLRVRLMRSTNAAISVDLPLDRGPATRTRPSGSAQSAWISRDRPSWSADDRRGRDHPEHAAGAAVIAEAHAADAADIGDVDDPLGAVRAQRSARSGIASSRSDFDVRGTEHRLGVEHADLAVHADRRARVREEVQRLRAARRREAEQPVEAGQPRRGREPIAVFPLAPTPKYSGY